MTKTHKNEHAKHTMTAEERKVIVASSLGTIVEWYDFYIYGTLASILAKQFFSSVDLQCARLAHWYLVAQVIYSADATPSL